MYVSFFFDFFFTKTMIINLQTQFTIIKSSDIKCSVQYEAAHAFSIWTYNKLFINNDDVKKIFWKSLKKYNVHLYIYQGNDFHLLKHSDRNVHNAFRHYQVTTSNNKPSTNISQ